MRALLVLSLFLTLPGCPEAHQRPPAPAECVDRPDEPDTWRWCFSRLSLGRACFSCLSACEAQARTAECFDRRGI
jgi:hypothetical protein